MRKIPLYSKPCVASIPLLKISQSNKSSPHKHETLDFKPLPTFGDFLHSLRVLPYALQTETFAVYFMSVQHS